VLLTHCVASTISIGSTSKSQTPTNSEASDDVIVHQIMPISRINQSKKRHNNFSPATPHKKRAEGPKQGAVQDPNPLEANVWYSESPATPRILGGAHAVRRQATSAAWVDLLPKLVYPLMVWAQCAARNNLDPLANAGSEDFACHCGATRSSYCWIISFQSLYFSLGILQCKLNGEPRY